MFNFKKSLAALFLASAIPAFAQYVADPALQGAPQKTQQIPQVQIHVPQRKRFDPLHMNVIMQFPANVKTVQQAAQYLLETAKYKLVLNPDDPEASKQILSRALLPQDNNGSLQSIENALLIIGGDDTVLIIDHQNKLITFEFLDH